MLFLREVIVIGLFFIRCLSAYEKEYKGCFQGGFPFQHTTLYPNSVEICGEYCRCRWFDAIGLQNGYACECGFEGQYGNSGTFTCNVRCEGTPSQICGAPFTNSVWQMTYKPVNETIFKSNGDDLPSVVNATLKDRNDQTCMMASELELGNYPLVLVQADPDDKPAMPHTDACLVTVVADNLFCEMPHANVQIIPNVDRFNINGRVTTADADAPVLESSGTTANGTGFCTFSFTGCCNGFIFVQLEDAAAIRLCDIMY